MSEDYKDNIFVFGVISTVTVTVSICWATLHIRYYLKDRRFIDYEKRLDNIEDKQNFINKILNHNNIEEYKNILNKYSTSLECVDSNTIVEKNNLGDIENQMNEEYNNNIIDTIKLKNSIELKERIKKNEIDNIDKLSIINEKNIEINNLKHIVNMKDEINE